MLKLEQAVRWGSLVKILHPSKEGECSRPGAGRPATPAPRSSSVRLLARLDPESPVKCDLAASLFPAATGRQEGVCTYSTRFRAPVGSSNTAFAVSAFVRRRPEMRLERGDSRPQARTRSASTFRLLGEGSSVLCRPRWSSIASTGRRGFCPATVPGATFRKSEGSRR